MSWRCPSCGGIFAHGVAYCGPIADECPRCSPVRLEPCGTPETRDEYRARVRGELERFAAEDPTGFVAMALEMHPCSASRPGEPAVIFARDTICDDLSGLLDELEAEERPAEVQP